LSFDSQTIVEKVALNSFKEIIHGLSLNFLILPKELLTSMVYMGVKVTVCNRIYGDGAKASAATNIPH